MASLSTDPEVLSEDRTNTEGIALLARASGGNYLWSMQRGQYRLQANVYQGTTMVKTPEIGFVVK